MAQRKQNRQKLIAMVTAGPPAVIAMAVSGGEKEIHFRMRSNKSVLVAACCSCMCMLAVVTFNVLFLIFGATHLNNKHCDPLDDGVGIAEWMMVMGIMGLISLCCQCGQAGIGVMGGSGPSGETEGAATKPAMFLQLCNCLFTIFAFCWFIYGCVVVFEDHPDDSGCPGEVHEFGFIYLIITFCVMGLVCLGGCCMVILQMAGMGAGLAIGGAAAKQ